MNPEEIPQLLRDIADTLEQLLGGGQGGEAGAPVDIAAMMPAGGGQGGQEQGQ